MQLEETIAEYIKEVKVITEKHQYYHLMKENMEFKYIKVTKTAKAPEKVAGNACYDLSYDGESVKIEPGERLLLSTGLILVFPFDYHGFIKSRSGLAWKHGLAVIAGIIDNSYTSETKVVLVNHSSMSYTIERGDRIAQIYLTKDNTFPLKEISLEELKETNRGLGFGSSGK